MQKNSDCANAIAIMNDSSKVRVKGPPTCAIILWMIVPKETSVRHTKTTSPCNLCFNIANFQTARINFNDLIKKQKVTWKPSPNCTGSLQPEEDFILFCIFLSCAKTQFYSSAMSMGSASSRE